MSQLKKKTPGKSQMTQTSILIKPYEYKTSFESLAQELTPEKMASKLKSNDRGDIAETMWIFEKMEKKDPDIRSDFEVRYDALKALEWSIKPADPDDAQAVLQADFVSEILEDKMENIIELLADAIPKGFSLVEKTYTYDGKYLVPAKFDLIQPWNLTMRQDTTKNLIAEFPFVLDSSTSKATELEPREKFLYHRPGLRYLTTLDNGLMVTLCWLYIFRNYNWKDWLGYVEKFGIPFILARFDSGATDKEKEELAMAATEMVNGLTAVMPSTTNIEVKEFNTKGEGPHERIMEMTKRMISKVILGTPLVTNEAEHQARASTIEHSKIQDMKLRADAKAMERTLNKQLIETVIDLNFGEPLYPHLEFITDDEASLDQLKIFFDMGLPVSIKALRQRYRVAEPEDEKDTLVKQQSLNPFQDMQAENNPFIQQENENDQKEDEEYEQPKPGKLKDKAKRTALSDNRKIDTDRMLQYSMDRSAAEFEKLKNEIKKKVKRWGPATTLSELEDVSVDILKNLTDLISGLNTASEAIGYASDITSKKAASLADSTFSTDPLSPEEAIKYIKRKKFISKWVLQAIKKKWLVRGEQITRETVDKILAKIKDLLVESAASGDTFEKFEKDLEELFVDIGISDQNRFRLRTIFDTNIQAAYNAGRWFKMRDPEVVKERSYWQYITAGDDRVRPSHRVMDGKVFPYDHPIWRTFYPPNGYNCRCTVRSLSYEEIREFGGDLVTDFNGNLQDEETGGEVNVQPDEGFDKNPDDLTLSGWET